MVAPEGGAAEWQSRQGLIPAASPTAFTAAFGSSAVLAATATSTAGASGADDASGNAADGPAAVSGGLVVRNASLEVVWVDWWTC